MEYSFISGFSINRMSGEELESMDLIEKESGLKISANLIASRNMRYNPIYVCGIYSFNGEKYIGIISNL